MDPCVELARLSIHHFVQCHAVLEAVPSELLSALAAQEAGVFVSIHTPDGELRGCMGSLRPMHGAVPQEIIHNAISACARDPRFPPVREDELEHLEIRVDVLSAMEPVADRAHLDPRRYGVLVSTPDGRKGVLLPDLEDVDTVEEQIAIACRKAGINPVREDFALQRFTVVRHTAGD
jgi:AmmeMemoRadiSam system protein A